MALKRRHRLLSRHGERAVGFAIAGAFLGIFLFHTGWTWRGVGVSVLNGALFFGLPALLPRSAFDDRFSSALVGASVGMLCGWIHYVFGGQSLEKHVWMVGVGVLGALIFWFGKDVWRD